MKVHETQLPPLESRYALEPDQVERYRRDGHIILRGVAAEDEIAGYRAAIREAADRFAAEQQPLAERDAYHKAFLQIKNLWERDEAIRRFVLARRFGRIAAELMGVRGVRIYHDQALYKEPGGGPTMWHQDQFYWPLDTDNTITMWMPLVDVTAEMGTLSFATGSQREGLIRQLAISEESEREFDRHVKERGFPIVNHGAMAAGDATFHSGWTLHSAPGNRTDTMREVMTIIYFADGARVVEPDTDNRRADLQRWLPGLKAGDVAASELNPLAYSA